MGHITAFYNLAVELAARGHSTSFLLPEKAYKIISNENPSNELINFIVITVPHVDGLPPGAQTASDIDFSAKDPLAIAFDAMSAEVAVVLRQLMPDIVFFDQAHWIPALAAEINIKTICYNTVSASMMAIGVVPARFIPKDRRMTAEELMEPPTGYPSSTVVLRREEAMTLSFICMDYGAVTFDYRIMTALKGCDAIAIRTCRELEAPMCDYLSSQFGRPVALAGPVFRAEVGKREEKWDMWLNKFGPKSVVYCCLGSQIILKLDQFQELVLGLEKTGLPFLAALSKPIGVGSIEEALPEGFLERVGGRGLIHEGWVPQTQILNHESVGCFVSHCGFASMWESLLTHPQIVLVPRLGDQILNTRILVEDLKVAVEVKRGEMGRFVKEDLCEAVESVMDRSSEVAKSIERNHAKWKDTFTSPGYMDGYIDGFIKSMYTLL